MSNFQCVYKSQIASAYGFSVRTLVGKINAEIARRGAENAQVITLGQWRRRRLLMPAQVRAITEMLGEYSHPEFINVTK